MCRITGFWDSRFRGQYDLLRVADAMRDTMVHGGPDDAGTFAVPERGLALGHRRLSIIDLSPGGHQPMRYDDGRFTITYNGEIYNYREVRAELERKGRTFASQSDTEVILAAYREWGTGCVFRFRGMWAFALWDEQQKKLVLCRDRAGVKPLYWYQRDGLFMFSSEIKAFHQHPGFRKELDQDSLATFFKYGSIPAPHTIFKDVHKLEPGHFLTVDEHQDVAKIEYWNAYDNYYKGLTNQQEGYWENIPDREVHDRLERLLRESFRLRMVADVPVGVFLSGGIDSSLVSALLTAEGFKLKTFTIGFNELKYNEAPHARKVARHLGTDHTELICTPQEAYDVIPLLPELYDEPFGDSSAIPTYLVSQLARRQVKVTVSADGGDELFCGYNWYRKLEWVFRRLNNPVTRTAIQAALRTLGPGGSARLYELFNFALPKVESFRDDYFKLQDMARAADFNDQYLKLLSQIGEGELAQMGLTAGQPLHYRTDALDIMPAMMLTDFQMYLAEDILVKVDRATMGVSLEGREPFLDNKLIEFACALPLRYKLRKGVSKAALREVLYRYVPRELVERPKQGFAVPVEDWFRTDLAKLFDEYVNVDRIRREGLLNAEVVGHWRSDFLSHRTKINTKLWYLFVYEMWAEKWLH